MWEQFDSQKDLILGDGNNPDTIPTFVADTPSHYLFDGVDDHFSSWPAMPDVYTVVLCCDDGSPQVLTANDTTIEAMLTTPGGFAGKVHHLLIYPWHLAPLEIGFVTQKLLRRV